VPRLGDLPGLTLARSSGRDHHPSILGDPGCATKYHQCVATPQRYLVSASGQVSLPAAVRHRWGLDDGGPVEMIDLGFGVLAVPEGAASRLLGELLSREDHLAFVRDIEDPDLATT
jgi:bifunctional DNA-binding transcriptional regulator/antitoxin component of YhaV-PrlF toxin-antitoxin module